MKSVKKSFFFVFILLITTTTFCNQKCFANNRKIIVGLDENVPPMGFLNDQNEIVGFDIDLAKEIFKEDVVFQPIDWEAKELELQTGKIDVVWNGLSKTPEREKNMLLTKSYMKNRQVIITKKDSFIENLEDLESKNLCVQKGSVASEILSESKISSTIKQTIELENMLNCLDEVKAGRSDAAVLDESLAKYYLNKNENLKEFKVLKEALSKEEYVIAVKIGNTELKEKIEQSLEKIYKSGKTKEISERWFGEDLFFWEESENTKSSLKKSNFMPILQGSLVTLELFLITIVFSLPLGFILCVIKNSCKITNLMVNIYTTIMRSTPLLLQLFFVFYGLPNVPIIGKYLSINDRFLAGSLTFILNYAAYFTEIFRSGFLSVDKGQKEAAFALGLTKIKTIQKILLPQVLKICFPTICNESITLVKDTALIFAIGVPELLSNTKNLVNSTADVTSYFIAALIYLFSCFLLTIFFRKLEKKFSF